MTAMRHDPSHGPGPLAMHAQRLSRPDPQRQGTLSIIIPAKNEAASLPQLMAEIAAAFRPLRDRNEGACPHRLDDFEIVLVDDGSTDTTPQVLLTLTRIYPELRPIRFPENFGQSAAIAAGLRSARGDWVAILDADLQNPPSELARLWDLLPGHDAALGWRIKREDVWTKRIISRWANRIRNLVLDQDIKDTGCAVRIFPRDLALRLPWFQGVHRFFGPLLQREGCRIVQAPVEHRPRPHGASHYNLWNRSINVMIDLLGVAWLMRRPVRYALAERVESSDESRPARQEEWTRP